MSYSAHSPRDGMPAQTYKSHINAVTELAGENALNIAGYGKIDGLILPRLAEASARYHDLGKLEAEKQEVLRGEKQASKLPFPHQDAGAAYYLTNEHFLTIAAVIISAHHSGLPNFSAEDNRGDFAFRDYDKGVVEKTNMLLPELARIHDSIITDEKTIEEIIPTGDLAVFLRLLLSCIVDADHTNTAMHYEKHTKKKIMTRLLPEERLTALDRYVSGLGGEYNKRNDLRSDVYTICRNSTITASISSCDSPVGTGKTTAVMAHLLKQSQNRGLRRIFVVLPFTNIIQQSVITYRNALVLPGENPEDVVAELHHRADFEDEDARHLNALWRAPIIVTTAVAFFETLASNKPSTLRRLHELPGSAVFLDESHAALPVKLLPIAWRWMNIFADEWSCYWVLASGSLNRFWQIYEIAEHTPERSVPEIVDNKLRGRLSVFEKKRIAYKDILKPISVDCLVELIAETAGPRLVIFNTVQNAAILADAYLKRYGRKCAEHLSTALTPKDREKTLERVLCRLKNKADTDWALFATSCAEAGLNLSFRNGFRELGSLVSLLQAAGRVNREDEYSDSQMWTFLLAESNLLNRNPSLCDASKILREYYENGIEIAPVLSTDSISKELRRHGDSGVYEKLIKNEKLKDFERVNKDFKVIESDTCIAVVDPLFIERMRNGKARWRELQMNSVHVARYKLKELKIPKIMTDIYHWDLPYDAFLGYMAGVVKEKRLESDCLII